MITHRNKTEPKSLRPGLLHSRAALLALCLFAASVHAQTNPQPDLFILSFDALRADHLGCYGYPKNTSPNVDRLAEQGVTYTQCYAIRGLTGPTLTSIASGLATHAHGILGHEPRSVSRHLTLLPEWLQQQGYQTVFFYANSMARQVGLDLYGWDYTFFRQRTEEVADRAAAFLQSHSPHNNHQKPLFMWVHFFYPHSPFLNVPPYTQQFDAPDEYWGPATGTQEFLNNVWAGKQAFDERDFQHVLALYDGTIRHADDLMGRVIDAIHKRRETNPGRKALICFTSDHGEELADHGRFFFHARSVWEGSCHVPLILSGLDELQSAHQVDRTISQVDILPTLLHLLKLPTPRPIDGLFQPPDNNSTTPNRAWGRQMITPIWWFRDAQWTYIYRPFPHVDAHIPYPTQGLFDRTLDRFEKNNLADIPAYDDIRARMHAQLEQVRHGTPLLPHAEILRADQPEPPKSGFHVYSLEDLPAWIFIEWAPARDAQGNPLPIKLLAFSDQPFLGIDGNLLSEGVDRQVVLAGSGDNAERGGLLAMETSEGARVSLECYLLNTPAWGTVTLGNRPVPDLPFSFSIGPCTP